MAVPALPPPTGVPSAPSGGSMMDTLVSELELANSYLSQIAREVTEQGRRREDERKAVNSAAASKPDKDTSWTTFLLDGFVKYSQMAANAAVVATHNRFGGIFQQVQAGGKRLRNFAQKANAEAKKKSIENGATEAEATGAGGLIRMAGAVGVAGTAVASFASAVYQITQAVNARALELAKFSPDIMLAKTNADIKTLFADFREAQELGPGMAHVMDASTDIWIEIREILLPIKKLLLEKLEVWLEWIKEFLPVIRGAVVGVEVAVEDGFDAMIEFLSGEWTKSGQILGNIPQHIADEIAKRAAVSRIPIDFKKLLDQNTNAQKWAAPAPDPAAGVNAAGLVIPGLIL